MPGHVVVLVVCVLLVDCSVGDLGYLTDFGDGLEVGLLNGFVLVIDLGLLDCSLHSNDLGLPHDGLNLIRTFNLLLGQHLNSLEVLAGRAVARRVAASTPLLSKAVTILLVTATRAGGLDNSG